MNKQYFSMSKTDNEATVNIYGDITSYPWEQFGEVSANNLVKQLDGLTDVSKINVYINSYGGEVAEGLAIYNALRRHKAKVITHCEGFACSIASVIFMAGDERKMSEASLLMIHNAWTYADGNADQLRKQADDLDKITQASVEAYKAHSTLSEEEIKALMDAESWILPSEALEYGFATEITKTETKNASQNARKTLLAIVKAHRQEAEKQAEDDNKNPPDTDIDDAVKEKGEENDDDKTATPPETDEDDKDEETDGADEKAVKNENKPADKLSGIFNAILKM